MLTRRNLPLTSMRAFECAARHLHLGRAGDELGVTHGAVSHQIRNLEEKLGVELFTRTHGRLALTASGKRLSDAVADGFDRMIAAAHDLDPKSVAGALTIGCTQTAASAWLIKHICAFQSAYPQIEIHIERIRAKQKSIRRDIEIAICYGRPLCQDRRLTELASPALLPVCSPKLVNQFSNLKKPEDLAASNLLHDQQNSWREWFSGASTPYPEDANHIYCNDTFIALCAARLGYGVALCNTLETREYMLDGTLVQALPIATKESHSYFLLTDQDDIQSSRARLFENWLTKAIAATELQKAK